MACKATALRLQEFFVYSDSCIYGINIQHTYENVLSVETFKWTYSRNTDIQNGKVCLSSEYAYSEYITIITVKSFALPTYININLKCAENIMLKGLYGLIRGSGGCEAMEVLKIIKFFRVCSYVTVSFWCSVLNVHVTSQRCELCLWEWRGNFMQYIAYSWQMYSFLKVLHYYDNNDGKRTIIETALAVISFLYLCSESMNL